MITKNILKDFMFHSQHFVNETSRKITFEISHNFLPLLFSSHIELTIKFSPKQYTPMVYSAIHRLYERVMIAAINNKPELPTETWGQTVYVAYWNKEKQCWACLGRDGTEMLNEEDMRIENLKDEPNMR